VIRAHSASGSVLAFLRGEPGTGEVLVALNQSATAQMVTLPAGTWVDAVTGESITGSASLEGRGWRYLVRQ